MKNVECRVGGPVLSPLSLQFITTVRLGVKSLMLHKLRSVLTMLGIIFGVCSVIAMLAIGEEASYEAQQAIKKLGSQNIIIRSIKPPEDAKMSGLGRGIAMQFLVETVVLSVGGGLVGVVVGIVAPLIVSHLTTMRTIVTPWSVLLAFSIPGAIGIIFGIYPAKAAAELDPIEALRHE